jgi:hypothetical protein
MIVTRLDRFDKAIMRQLDPGDAVAILDAYQPSIY